MKKALALILLVCLSVTSVTASWSDCGDDPSCDPCRIVRDADYNFGRGMHNILTFWLEVPRKMWYEGCHNAYLGPLTGTIEGTAFAGARLAAGLSDVLTLGTSGSEIYSESFPSSVLDEPWCPPVEAYMVEIVEIDDEECDDD